MSAGSQARVAGYMVLLTTCGENLAYLGATIQAVVNRDIVKGKDFFRSFSEGAVNFSLAGLSEIEILKTGIVKQPIAGEYFVDAQNFRHRIRLVTQTDITWKCFCTPVAI